MSAVNPAIHPFWSSAFIATPAMQTLDAWSGIVEQPPMHELVENSPPSRISSALRRVIEQPVPAGELEPASELLTRIDDHREYVASMLRFCVDAFVRGLQSGPDAIDFSAVSSWLEEAVRVQKWHREDIIRLKAQIMEMNRKGLMPANAGLWMLQVAARLYSRLYRVRVHVKAIMALQSSGAGSADALEIRRRLDWILSLREFARPEEASVWPASPVVVSDRHLAARQLLAAFRPGDLEGDVEMIERTVAAGIQGKVMAFEIDRVLAETKERPAARTKMEKSPERYDAGLTDYVHQFRTLTMPFQGVQAACLGLWAAGNELKIYTSSDGATAGHAAFINDFPLLKVAFGLAAPQRPCDLANDQSLAASPHYMDKKKWRGLVGRHFDPIEDPDMVAVAKSFSNPADVGVLKKTKIPFPEFPFDVLVDSPSVHHATLRGAGFGNRWLGSGGSADAILKGLKIYFSVPQPPVSEPVRRWLEVLSF